MTTNNLKMKRFISLYNLKSVNKYNISMSSEFFIPLIHSVGESSSFLIDGQWLFMKSGGTFKVFYHGAFRNDIFDDIDQLD